MVFFGEELGFNFSAVFYFTAACPVLCSGNGQYSKGRCLCYSGWKGTECDVPTTQCIDPQCGGRGICIMGSCACNSGYKGENCEEGKWVNMYANTSCCCSSFQLAHPALLILLDLGHMHSWCFFKNHFRVLKNQVWKSLVSLNSTELLYFIHSQVISGKILSNVWYLSACQYFLFIFYGWGQLRRKHTKKTVVGIQKDLVNFHSIE